MKKIFYKKDNKKLFKQKNFLNIFNFIRSFNSPKNGYEKNKNIIKKIKQQKNMKRKKLFLIMKIAILALILFLGFSVFSIIGKFNKKLNLNDIGLSETDEVAERQISNITNILLLGIDDNNVSDAIMIASIDKTNKKLNLISIARDSLVPIENPKTKKTFYSKINEAYSNGGEATTIKTLNKNFHLRLMDYITINFEGLVDVIDQLNGVTIKISKKESKDIDGIINTTKNLKKKHSAMLYGQHGDIHLNGSQAVAYVRIRKTETLNGLNDDFGRNYRQRLIMKLVLEKIMNLEKSQIPGLIKTLLPHMKTSLSFKTIFNIYSCVKGKNFEFKPIQVPMPAYTIDPGYIYNSKSTVFYDIDYAGDLINELIYNNIDPETYIENNPPKVKKLNIHKPSKKSTETENQTPLNNDEKPKQKPASKRLRNRRRRLR